MTRTPRRTPRPRAIAVPASTVTPTRVVWVMAAALALLVLLAVRPAVSAPFEWRPAATIAAHDASAAAEVEAEPLRATQRPQLRTPDRARRSTLRSGPSLRRIASSLATLPPVAPALATPSLGGTAPFGTLAAATPPARGTTVHGVRGPPSLVLAIG